MCKVQGDVRVATLSFARTTTVGCESTVHTNTWRDCLEMVRGYRKRFCISVSGSLKIKWAALPLELVWLRYVLV